MGTTVLGHADLSGKEPYIQVCVDMVMTSGSLGGVMVTILAQNAMYVDSSLGLGTMFPIVNTPTRILIFMDEVKVILSPI